MPAALGVAAHNHASRSQRQIRYTLGPTEQSRAGGAGGETRTPTGFRPRSLRNPRAGFVFARRGGSPIPALGLTSANVLSRWSPDGRELWVYRMGPAVIPRVAAYLQLRYTSALFVVEGVP